jgi:Rab11 family-interacting protein 3/4
MQTDRFRIDELEEEVREMQLNSKEQLEVEQKRTKEMIARLDREKQLEVENYAIK